MDFDEMLETWRTQDKAPIYRANRDLLLELIQMEQTRTERELGVELFTLAWAPRFIAACLMAVVFALLFAAASSDALGFTPNIWDYTAAGIATGTILLSAGVSWMNFRRRAERKRGLGNSLQETIRHNLSRIDYQLSWYGQLASSLPTGAGGLMLIWVSFRLNAGSFGWFEVLMVAWLVFMFGATGRHMRKLLLEHKRRLNQVLELLDASE